MTDYFYRIGTEGKAWGDEEKAAWLAEADQKTRSYKDEVIAKIEKLRSEGIFDVEQYGALSMDTERYPLFCISTKDWDAAKPSVLVTGGVHGYEKSGVSMFICLCLCLCLWLCLCVSPFPSRSLTLISPHRPTHNPHALLQVQGALQFASTEMSKYADRFNILVCPCVSPWYVLCVCLSLCLSIFLTHKRKH